MNDLNFGMVILIASAATTYTKPLVDILKRTPMPTPSWSLPLIAIVFGIIICFLISMMLGQAILSQVTIGTSCLAGISSGLGAVMMTEVQRNADSSQADSKEGRM